MNMNDIVLISIPETTIKRIVEQAVTKALASQEAKQVAETKSRIVDLDGLIKARPYVGTKSTIYKKVSAGQIPHSKRGKRLFFDLNTIDEWLMSNKIKTAAEIEQETDNYLNRKNKRVG